MIRILRHGIALFLSLLLLGSCSQNSDLPEENAYANCRYEQPQAIFAKSTPTIDRHDFEHTGEGSVETIRFEDGSDLQIIQSGCNFIRQEFLLRLEGNLSQESSEFWIRQAVNLFYNLGSLDAEYATMLFWAEAIGDIAMDIELGREYYVQPGVSVTVDKVTSEEDGLLIVTLEQVPD